jgi:hypothetical protein
MGASLLGELRRAGLGVRDLFDGRQEPLSWYFRVVALDQSELDILESGAVDHLQIPTALVELSIDEMALGLANIGVDGLATYLRHAPTSLPAETEPAADKPQSADDFLYDPNVMLGLLGVDVAPPPLWLDERESNPATNERLAARLTNMARQIGEDADAVEVHIEGALDPDVGWASSEGGVRPAGISVHFTFDIPLVGTEERELARVFARGASVASEALERIREVFRAG